MIKRQEILADYLIQLVEDKGEAFFLEHSNDVQVLICGFVASDLHEVLGSGEAVKVES